MSELNLPWNEYNEVELATNELVSSFSMNRCLRRLLDNDNSFLDLLSESNALELATSGETLSGISVGDKAVNVNDLEDALKGDGARWGSALSGTTENALLSANGYQVFPSGVIMQWGNNAYIGSTKVYYPIAFSVGCTPSVVASQTVPYPDSTGNSLFITSITNEYFIPKISGANANGSEGSPCTWQAMGY